MQSSTLAIAFAVPGLLLLGACSKHNDAAGGSAASTQTASAAPTTAMPKPGLWETTVSADGMPGPMKTRMCIGAPAPGVNPFAPPPQAGQACSKSSFTKTSSGYAIDVECQMNGMTMTTKGDVSGDFSSSYKTVMKTKMSGPGIPAAMQTERISTAEAKYVGACPADLKPGMAKQAS